MRFSSFSFAATLAAAVLFVAASARAQVTTIYSFEPGEVAFAATAGSTAAISTTTGVTDGAQSLQYGWQGTFVGARSAEVVDADIINAINQAQTIRLDLTNVAGGGPSGNFSDIFLVIFSGGNQYQTNGIPIPRPPELDRPVTTALDLPLTLFGTSDRLPQLDPSSSWAEEARRNLENLD